MHRSDTALEVERLWDERWRSLSPEARFLIGLEWIRQAREMMVAGIRWRDPSASEEEVRVQLARQLYGLNFISNGAHRV